MKKFELLGISFALLLMGLLLGCQGAEMASSSPLSSGGDPEPTGVSRGDGKLKVLSWPGPAPATATLTEAQAFFDESELLASPDGAFKALPATSVLSAEIEIVAVHVKSSEDRFFAVQMPNFTLNLRNLDSEFAAALVRAKLPSGAYDEVRLITASKGTARLDDGTTEDLIVPSGPQSGIKAKFEPALRVEDQKLTIAVLHFDVSKSFVQNANGVHFKPVIRTVGGAPVTPPPAPSPSPSPSPSVQPSPSPSTSPSPAPSPSPSVSSSPLPPPDPTEPAPPDGDDALFFPVIGI